MSLKVCSDNLFSLKTYSDAAREAERPLDVIIECDTSQKRAGVKTPREALALAQVISKDPMLNFAGLLFYPLLDSWPQTQIFLDKMVKDLAFLGCQPCLISTGRKLNFSGIGKLLGATEHWAINYFLTIG